MESLFSKYNSQTIHNQSIQSRIRSGSNKENQAPTGGNLRAFKNHHSTGPIGIPFKAKNSNTLHFHNGMNNLLRNQTNSTFEKLNFNNNFNNNSLNVNLNNSSGGFLRRSNSSYSSDDGGLNSLQSSINSLRPFSKGPSNPLSISSNSSILQTSNNFTNRLNLYKSQNGSSSSLFSHSSNENSSREDKRHLPPPPKQNIMYHEQRYKTELCRAFEEQNNCVYGDRCMFAHGLWELKRAVTRHPKYKTQKCVAYEEQGLCMFGTRCSFLHEKIGTAEEIVDSMLRLNKQTLPMPENPSKKPDPECFKHLDTIDEQEILAKSLDGMEQRAKFLSNLKSENLFDWTTSKPVFNFHPRSSNSAYENIVRLDRLTDNLEKDKLLPDLTLLLVDDHANSNTLLFNDDSLTNSSRLPIFEKISSATDLQSMCLSESNSIDTLNCSNNSSKSSSSKSSKFSTHSTSSSTMSIGSNNMDFKSMDLEFDKFFQSI